MRTFIRGILVLALVVILAFVALQWRNGTLLRHTTDVGPTAPTSGTVDTSTLRERGAELGEKVAVATAKVKETAAEARLTTKIKAKMALDDHVKARAIDVSTSNSTVTLTGIVESDAEHDRAVRLARDTVGVTDVIDQLRVLR
jgi:osmotically-inducible protein OsmY